MKNKNQILEEEIYRNQIKANLRNTEGKTKSSSGCLIAIIVIIAFFCLAIYLTVAAINPAKQFEQAEQTATEAVVGKYAYNATNGVYRGKIIDRKPCNTNTNIECFVVTDEESQMNTEAPIANVIVKDTPPTE